MSKRPDSWAWKVFASRVAAGLNNGALPMPARTEPCDDEETP